MEFGLESASSRTRPWTVAPWTVAPWTVALVVIVLTTLARLAYNYWLSPWQLAGDEAYYWVQSLHPDWSYNEKGALLPWLIYLSCQAFGHTEFAVRLPVILGGTATMWLAGKLTMAVAQGTRFEIERAGLFAVMMALLVPALQFNAQISTQDGLLLPWTLAACWIGLRIVRRWTVGDSNYIEWAAFWAWMAVCMYLRFSGPLVLACGAAFVLIRWRTLRWNWPRLIGEQAVGLAVFAVLFAPIVWWNHAHGWPTFEHTAGHLGMGGDQAGLKQRGNFVGWLGVTVGGIVGAYGPGAVVLIVWGSVVWVRQSRGTIIDATTIDATNIGGTTSGGTGVPPVLLPVLGVGTEDREHGRDARATDTSSTDAQKKPVSEVGNVPTSKGTTIGGTGVPPVLSPVLSIGSEVKEHGRDVRATKTRSTHTRATMQSANDAWWIICCTWTATLFFVLLSFVKPVVPSWPLTVLVPGIVPAAILASRRWPDYMSRLRDWKRTRRSNPSLRRPSDMIYAAWGTLVWYGIGGLILLAIPTLPTYLPKVGDRIRQQVISRITEGKLRAQPVQTVLGELQPQFDKPLRVVTTHYDRGSLLWFYLNANPDKFKNVVHVASKRPSTYDTWDDTRLDNPALLGSSMLLVGTSDTDWPAYVRFRTISPTSNPGIQLGTEYLGKPGR